MPNELFVPNRKPTLPAPSKVLLGKATSLADYYKEGYEVFSLGPIYVYGEIPESLPETFARSKPQFGQPKLDTKSTQLRFDRIVVESCLEWGPMLDVMDKTSYLWFKQWIQSFTFMNREKKLVLFPRIYSATITDPIALDKCGKGNPVTLDIWSVTTQRWALSTEPRTSSLVPDAVKMRYGPPDSFALNDVQKMQPDLKAVYNDLKRGV